MSSVLLKILNAGGVGGAINEATNMIVALANGKIHEMVVFVLGLLIALWVGTVGYKNIKLLCTVVFGIVGYATGLILFRMFELNFELKVGGFVDYLVGVAVMLLLGYLAYKKFAYALFVMAGAIGFMIGYFIYPSYILSIIVAIVVAMVAMHFVRYGFISILSISAGFFFMGMLSAMFPNVKWLRLTEGFMGTLLAMLVSLVFVAIQLYISRTQSKTISGISSTKRVKIRRVFDAW